MTPLWKSLLKSLLGPVDLVLSILVVPAAHLLRLYRRLGSGRFPRTTSRLKRIGLFPLSNHYYEPLFDDRLLAHPLDAERPLPGLDLNVASQLDLLDALSRSDELVALDLARPADALESFHISNGMFESGDADFLYQFIRHFKPRTVIEIGSGHSTKLARIALRRNDPDTGGVHHHLCIEPYEQPWLERLDGVSVMRRRIEDCDIDWAHALAAGDLLFVDSSHMIRPQGDVLKEYLEIFPRLAPGVFVHVHDVFTPRDYPKAWVVDEVRFWNEQYLLEALLADSDRYEVVAALNFLKHAHFERLARVCPYLTPDSQPASFYFRVRP